MYFKREKPFHYNDSVCVHSHNSTNLLDIVRLDNRLIEFCNASLFHVQAFSLNNWDSKKEGFFLCVEITIRRKFLVRM